MPGQLFKTETFDNWLSALKDRVAKANIAARLDRLIAGNPGDVKPVGDGVSEMRVDHGPGYRVYFTQHRKEIVLLLCGGDKSSQSKDIAKAKKLAANWNPP